MSLEGYQEALESQKQKEEETMKDQFNEIQSQMHSVITTLNMNQSTKNTFAKQLFNSGIYKQDTNS